LGGDGSKAFVNYICNNLKSEHNSIRIKTDYGIITYATSTSFDGAKFCSLFYFM